jgi:DNA-binding GntR family transcriptional regulator|tara:strand:+ start:643 stop:1329 length:687 start_codon:yes stop_codon:yes gene_type:complete
VSQNTELSPIVSIQLKDAAYLAIRSAITNLELEPGLAISENMLVKQLGVSKTPIRAALGRLEAEGMVVTIPFKGTFVREADDRDAQGLFELRIALESAAVRAVCIGATDDELAGLLDVAYQASMEEAVGEHDSALLGIGDFHDRLVALSGNVWLEAAYVAISGPLARIRMLSGDQASSIEMSSSEHVHLVAALVARDGEFAVSLIETHLNRVRDLYQSCCDSRIAIVK